MSHTESQNWESVNWLNQTASPKDSFYNDSFFYIHFPSFHSNANQFQGIQVSRCKFPASYIISLFYTIYYIMLKRQFIPPKYRYLLCLNLNIETAFNGVFSHSCVYLGWQYWRFCFPFRSNSLCISTSGIFALGFLIIFITFLFLLFKKKVDSVLIKMVLNRQSQRLSRNPAYRKFSIAAIPSLLLWASSLHKCCTSTDLSCRGGDKWSISVILKGSRICHPK